MKLIADLEELNVKLGVGNTQLVAKHSQLNMSLDENSNNVALTHFWNYNSKT